MTAETDGKPKILVVEYDRVQRDLILLALMRIDCEVLALQKGKDILQAIETYRPDIVLLDLFLPKISGLDVLEDIQQRGALSQLTVIVVSGMGFGEIVEQAREKGAYDFLIKPIDTDLLIKRVARALKRRDG